MSVSDSMDHSKCYFFMGDETPMIEVLRFEGGKERKPAFEKNKIVFVMEGGILLTYKRHPEVNIAKGQFCFIPSSVDVSYTTTNESVIMVLRLQDYNFLCEGCHIERLFDTFAEYRKNGVMHDPGINTLEANTLLWDFFNGLHHAISNGLKCRFYFELKVKEMSAILSACYSHDQLQNFFSPVLSPDMEYSEYVRRNHHLFRTVNEFAASMHMTPKKFARKFFAVFGETPHLWMNRERAQRIYSELYSGRKSIIQVADEYGFLSQAHFNKYCKREFDMTPGEIRKRYNS